MRSSTSLRVLHGPVNIGNQPWTLSRAERRLGAASDLVVNYGTWLHYPADKTLSESGALTPLSRLRRFGFGLAGAWQYDVLHFYFGRTFTMPDGYRFGQGVRDKVFIADLLAARRLGRKVFMTLQGCDARIASMSNRQNAWTMCAPGRCSVYQACLDTNDAQRLSMIKTVLPLCDRVFYLNPEIGHFVPGGTFLPYANVDVASVDVRLPSPSGRPRIVHAPSDGAIKGTPLILDALEQLRDRFDFDLVLVQGKAHAEAMELYRSADLAIDQVLAGWYGGFAVELMAMGKPVAGYVREEDLDFVDARMRRDIPILQLRPGHLVDDLAAILARRAEWTELGRRARSYVEAWHNPDVIAGAMLAAYRSPTSAFELRPGTVDAITRPE